MEKLTSELFTVALKRIKYLGTKSKKTKVKHLENYTALINDKNSTMGKDSLFNKRC